MNKPTISIFGAGKVGNALRLSLENAGYQINSVFGSDEFPEKVQDLGDLIFITTPDSVIEQVAKKLSDSFPDFEDKTVVHCSGTLSSESLKSLKNRDTSVASFHPMKSVLPEQSSFEGVWFDMEGDEEALKKLNGLAQDIGANAIEINADAKSILHASAVMASNYLVTLLNNAVRTAELAEIDSKTAIKMLLPLVDSTIKNIKENGIENSLTGPVARGDISTVEKHVKLLKEEPELLSLYKKLGSFTVDIADLDNNSEAALKDLFNKNS